MGTMNKKKAKKPTKKKSTKKKVAKKKPFPHGYMRESNTAGNKPYDISNPVSVWRELASFFEHKCEWEQCSPITVLTEHGIPKPIEELFRLAFPGRYDEMLEELRG
jgi:hypothetical protein